MVEIQEKKLCTGCGACAAACPVSCIQMQADEEGFLYPLIDKQQCIDCGKCEHTCPVIHRPKLADDCVAFAAKTRNDDLRLESSSGGVFSEIAQYILEQGGVVIGAAFTDDFSVEHICIDTAEQLGKLRGSKYVQSRIGQTYHQAKQYLEEGKPVLFTGTPCCIAGLYSFLGKDYDKLYTQDIICHGVPSPAVWERYVEFREKKAGAKMENVFFRSKSNGWRSYSLRLAFANGKVQEKALVQDPFMQSVLRDLCLRPSCYNCAFKTRNRCADFTLADFWGVENCNPGMDDNKGTSLVLIHSSKGQILFNCIKDNILFEQTDFEKAISFNSAIEKSVAYKLERNAFMKCLREKGFSTATHKYLKTSVILRLKRMVKRMLKKMRGE